VKIGFLLPMVVLFLYCLLLLVDIIRYTSIDIYNNMEQTPRIIEFPSGYLPFGLLGINIILAFDFSWGMVYVKYVRFFSEHNNN
jgi:hypothetical protein